MANAAEAQRAADNERMKIQSQISELRRKRSKRVADIEDEATADYRNKKRERDNVQFQIDSLMQRIRSTESAAVARKDEIERYKNDRARLIKEWKSLQTNSQAVKAEQVQFNESDFCCPMCHRQFDIEDIETKEAEIIESFEKQRESTLASIARSIADNEHRGSAIKTQIQRATAALEASEASIKADNETIEQLKASDIYRAELTMPDATPLIAADSELAKIDSEIAELEAKTEQPATPANNAELKAKRDTLSAEIDSLKSRLKKRDYNERTQARIDELEKQLQRRAMKSRSLNALNLRCSNFQRLEARQ